jgi:predicted nucleic-acid-binding Zn-ribbon protein
MKKTTRCPKCDGRRILHVTHVADAVAAGLPKIDEGLEPGLAEVAASPMRIARVPNPKNPSGSDWSLSSKVATAGLLEAYVCRACGYTEWYTKDPESIPVDGKIVVELTGPPPDGTYR